MLVLIGPSASGKTEIAKILIKKYNLKKFITYTTRPIRVGEFEGIDYHYVTVEEFVRMRDNGEFVETTYYNNNFYGSRKQDVTFEKVVVLDPNGLNAFYQNIPDKIISVLMEAPVELRRARMVSRGDRLDDINLRIFNDNIVFNRNNLLNIDYIVRNDNIDLEELSDYIYKLYLKSSKK